MRLKFTKALEKLALDVAQLAKPLMELDDVAIMAMRAAKNSRSNQPKLEPIKQDRSDH